ncbi:pyridoxal phosphate-dependent transferase [Lactarius quietus]|nr:pyridoxal phosphate-dependent transferase [Lactarius quietus]
MEPEPHLRLLASPVSGSVAKWIPYLRSFFQSRDGYDAAAFRSLPAPGSLRDAHHSACAWFLGPKAENADYFRMSVETILNDVIQFRRNFSPEDEDFIDAQAISSSQFKKSMAKLRTTLTLLSRLLPQHSVPFHSPRYIAHMVTDVSMPATLGYLMGLMYNPNNVGAEGGPITNVIEHEVGQQLCNMLGFYTDLGDGPQQGRPTAWGHITCDGSIANLESMWVARNLKFYPLTVRRAIVNEPSFAHVVTHFRIRLCSGDEKVFVDCDTWELLNLAPDEAVSLTTRISETFGLSKQAFQTVLNTYLIQTTGKDDLEKYFGIERPPQYLCPKTAHYSWPKAAAITGIGSRNMIRVPVDEHARLDFQALDTLLAECLKHRRAVYAIVVIIGTTEHGSVDPLSEVLEIRRKYQQLGLSFLIHADAAWGGYFTSMLVPNPGVTGSESHLDDPTLFVSEHTVKELHHLRYADSVTLDPHKSGYTPFPAGALCYQDGRMRFMVTWNSHVIGVEEESLKMGVYGIEGSKPGAAPVAAWLGHEVIGLHSGGFGYLLGKSAFASTMMYGHWATMSIDHPSLLVVPFRMLPSEMRADTSAERVDEERRYIRDVLLRLTREELANDPKACALMRQMGPDLVVNAFSCNFRVDGAVNEDILEANYLNARIYDRLSFKSTSEKLDDQKLFIMSSILSQKEYGPCLTNFKRRIGLSGQEDLFVLVNVTMSPFAAKFTHTLAHAFREVAEEQVKISAERNRPVPARRAFVLQGNGQTISFVHMPYFGASSLRQQCILKGELSGAGLKAYTEAKRAKPIATYVACTLDEEDISIIIKRKSLRCMISELASQGISPISEGQITKISVLKYRPLNSCHLDPTYPSNMPFYLYGTTQEMHIDHVLLRAPNAQLSAGEVMVELHEGDRAMFAAGLEAGLIAVADAIPEFLMQPLSASSLKPFFHPGAKLAVSIYHDRNAAQSQGPGICDQLGDPIARGTITLGENTFTDTYMINADVAIMQQAQKRSLTILETTQSSQEHPLFRGHGPGGPREHRERAKTWRNMWSEALTGQSQLNSDSNTRSSMSTSTDSERGNYVPSLARWTTSLFGGQRIFRPLALVPLISRICRILNFSETLSEMPVALICSLWPANSRHYIVFIFVWKAFLSRYLASYAQRLDARK